MIGSRVPASHCRIEIFNVLNILCIFNVLKILKPLHFRGESVKKFAEFNEYVGEIKILIRKDTATV